MSISGRRPLAAELRQAGINRQNRITRGELLPGQVGVFTVLVEERFPADSFVFHHFLVGFGKARVFILDDVTLFHDFGGRIVENAEGLQDLLLILGILKWRFLLAEAGRALEGAHRMLPLFGLFFAVVQRQPESVSGLFYREAVRDISAFAVHRRLGQILPRLQFEKCAGSLFVQPIGEKSTEFVCSHGTYESGLGVRLVVHPFRVGGDDLPEKAEPLFLFKIEDVQVVELLCHVPHPTLDYHVVLENGCTVTRSPRRWT